MANKPSIAGDIARVGAGAFAPIINAIGARRVHRWVIINLDTNEKLEGQFGPVELRKQPGNPTYAEHISLNREKPILQFCHGNADRFTFTAFFFATHDGDEKPAQKLTVLENWTKIDPVIMRPPRVKFALGDGQVSISSAVIESLGDVSYYDPPKEKSGGIRGVSVPVTLREYTPWTLKFEPLPQTRYHRARRGDYFEYLAWYEYGNAMLGDVVRKIHPDKLLLEEGDTVTLHSFESLRLTAVVPTSNVFKGVTTSRDSAQRTLRQQVQDRNGGDYNSTVVRET